jgi:acetyltransferase
MYTHLLNSMFNPRAIAVFGASESDRSVGGRVFRNLIEGGFEGLLVPINPHHEELAGRHCYPSLKEVGEKIDLAVIATPASTVAEIIEDCAQEGVLNAIVLSAGFREIGQDGLEREAMLKEKARRLGVRIIGPNCVGVVRPWLGMNATFLNAPPPRGRLALVSQSGALCSAIADWAAPHHLGFSALVSLGNSMDIDFGEVVSFLANDPKTDAILLYVEGVRDARSFVSALRSAARIKPVIVLKSGHHNTSGKAANTHTGALIGSDAVFDAALERAGAVRAPTFGELFAAAEILAATTRADGRRLGIVTNGGGAGVLAADRAGDLHLDLPSPAPQTIERLDKVLSPFWSRSNPVDILGDASPEAYAEAVSACLEDPNFDGLLVMLTPQAMTAAESAAEALETSFAAARKRGLHKPVLACWMGESSVAEARTRLSMAGIPDFTTPEKAVEAFSYLARHHLNQQMAREVPGPVSDLSTPDIEGARIIIEGVLHEGREMLSDVEAKAVLRAFRIPVNTTLTADSAGAALIAAETVGLPCVMKIHSPQISHKTEVGGVRTNLMTAADVHGAYNEMVTEAKQKRPDAEIKGVTVEAMVEAAEARELVVGVAHDPIFGPTILFGAGGTMVELLSDSAVSLPPLNEILAQRLVNRTRVARLLDAFRDKPAADKGAVIAVLLRVSELVCEFPEIQELDINPLFALPSGVIAVDARLRVKRRSPNLKGHEHMAIAPYPRDLIQTAQLSDGKRITIRPIRPEDAESEQGFVRSLSEEAKRMRFMQSVKELTPEMLARFTQIDYDRELALIAVVEDNGKQIQEGVARYVINPDELSCEFAIVVSDRRQHQGIGTRLMQALIEAARSRGLKCMVGEVLVENKKMLQLMDDLGFTRRHEALDPNVYQVQRDLQEGRR